LGERLLNPSRVDVRDPLEFAARNDPLGTLFGQLYVIRRRSLGGEVRSEVLEMLGQRLSPVFLK
jgi:hypothetical protein